MTNTRRHAPFEDEPCDRPKAEAYPHPLLALFVAAALVVAVIALAIGAANSRKIDASDESASKTEQTGEITSREPLGPTFTRKGDTAIWWYVFVDTDTDIQYLVNDRGGCTPRLDQYGSVMGARTFE